MSEENVKTSVDETKQSPNPNVRCGFAVGTNLNGEVFLEFLGEDPKIAELVGLAEIARRKIEEIRQRIHNDGFVLVNEKLDAIGSLVNRLQPASTSQKDTLKLTDPQE